MTTRTHVDVLRESDLEATARMLATTFTVDPAYRYLMPDLRTQEHGLTDFFRGNLRLHLAHGCTYTMRDDGAPVGTVTIRPAGGIRTNPWTFLRHGLVPFIASQGREAWGRLMWLKKTYDALEALASDHGVHAHVHMMAIRPDRQGTGLGGRLLEDAFDRATADSPSVPTVLTTHLERNVTFYRRAGFEIVSECVVTPPAAEGWTVWSMRKPGAPPRSRARVA